MPELIARAPLGSPAPLTLGTVTLAEADLGPITAIAPFPGQGAAVDRALKPLGLTFPAPNASASRGDARLLWTGREQAFLIGAAPPNGLEGVAAVTDQSDGWAALHLHGPGAEAVLMRLVPLDLRALAFPPGRCTRAGLNHLPMVLWRPSLDAFTILVFRSMARTAWHELETAMTGLAARARLA
ncbi:MAG TPA: sarcosine oxidase subunit gamma [Paracoccaceae bacterium]|nr:sarcosine oxidase subunit gamma [Paracoccaceae bacterium]